MRNPANLLERYAEKAGNYFVYWFHLLALFAIGGAISWSAVFAFWEMMQKGGASIEDILLLFIYLELGAMVGLYFSTNRMPVTFLLYVVITALTRMMIGYISSNHKPELELMFVAGAILLLAVAVLILKFASTNYPTKLKTIGLDDTAGNLDR